MERIAIFWFRRDLRLIDNTALFHALSNHTSVLPIFIFDEDILSELASDDPRVSFIYEHLFNIDKELKSKASSILCLKGKPIDVWKEVIQKYTVESVYVNKDYESYARDRDAKVAALLKSKGIEFLTFKDQVIFEENEILKKDGNPYTVFTPYKNKWLELFKKEKPKGKGVVQHFLKQTQSFPTLKELGFKRSSIRVRDYDLSQIHNYSETRNFPELDSTSYLSPHLRFGTVSIRSIISQLKGSDPAFLSELIWREFFMQILFHFPRVVNQNFKRKYDAIQWSNNEEDFERWCRGETGYPMVDAGMRQLNTTGYMHNRVRMICAGFLCKHLLIDWRKGEAYFAKKLLDYELSSNNGNWQWAAGTGCDAAPYFRIFNPIEQLKKFDKEGVYVRKWIPELSTAAYCDPIVDHKKARIRALERYKAGINN